MAGSNLVIHYYIAGGFSGATDFRLRAAPSFLGRSYELWSTLTTTKEHQRKSYSGQVATSQVEEIVQKMLGSKIWQVRHEHSNRWLDNPGAKIKIALNQLAQ